MTANKRKRVHMMLWAYLVFHAHKTPQHHRERDSWWFLLQWASLGGKPGEVIQ